MYHPGATQSGRAHPGRPGTSPHPQAQTSCPPCTTGPMSTLRRYHQHHVHPSNSSSYPHGPRTDPTSEGPPQQRKSVPHLSSPELSRQSTDSARQGTVQKQFRSQLSHQPKRYGQQPPYVAAKHRLLRRKVGPPPRARTAPPSRRSRNQRAATSLLLRRRDTAAGSSRKHGPLPQRAHPTYEVEGPIRLPIWPRGKQSSPPNFTAAPRPGLLPQQPPGEPASPESRGARSSGRHPLRLRRGTRIFGLVPAPPEAPRRLPSADAKKSVHCPEWKYRQAPHQKLTPNQPLQG
ncbi:hypothetical protein NDU88_004518 [Pleurodeles waltl]|uniref:Uncharacterized protein n=1 Tax=Pleurodeles waltl TaxID=8319 RepID=A0AAV7M7B3_PLEWA|nr:hypothetical protein NDU88_004518 [Pleurodeles waltl]